MREGRVGRMDRHDVCKEAEPVASGSSVPPRCCWAVRRESTGVDAYCDVRFNEDRIQGIGHRAVGHGAETGKRPVGSGNVC